MPKFAHMLALATAVVLLALSMAIYFVPEVSAAFEKVLEIGVELVDLIGITLANWGR